MAEAEAARQRLFFGLWPDAASRRRIAAISRPRSSLPGRPVKTSNLHMTLVFMGALTASQRDCACAVADTLSLPAFALSFGRMGCWLRPQVAWLAPLITPPVLERLVAGLNQGLVGCGVQPESRPYRPHITLRRKCGGPLAAAPPVASACWSR